jgi:hypothetical protein
MSHLSLTYGLPTKNKPQILMGLAVALAVVLAWFSYMYVGRIALVAMGLCTIPFMMALFRYPIIGAVAVAFLTTAMPTYVMPMIPTAILLITLFAIVVNKLFSGRLTWRFTSFAEWSLLLFVWLLTTVLWVNSYDYARSGTHYMAVLVVLVFVEVVRTPRQFLWVTVAAGLGMAVTWGTTLYGIYEFLTTGLASQVVSNANDVRNARFYGFWNNPNALAYSMIPFVALCFGMMSFAKSKGLRLLLGACTIAGFVTILMTLTRGALLATFVMILMVSATTKYRRKLIPIVIVTVVLTTLVLPSNVLSRIGTLTQGRADASLSERSVLSKGAIQVVERGFPFGTGIGSSFAFSTDYTLHRLTSIGFHDSYLDLLGEGGIMAILLFCGMTWSLFRVVRKPPGIDRRSLTMPPILRQAFRAGLVAILIGFTFEDVLGFVPYWLFFTLLSIAPIVFQSPADGLLTKTNAVAGRSGEKFIP